MYRSRLSCPCLDTSINHCKAAAHENSGGQNMEAVKDTATPEGSEGFWGFTSRVSLPSLPWFLCPGTRWLRLIQDASSIEKLSGLLNTFIELGHHGLENLTFRGFRVGPCRTPRTCWIPRKLQVRKHPKNLVRVKARKVLPAQRSHIYQCVEKETLGTNRCQSHRRSPWANP